MTQQPLRFLSVCSGIEACSVAWLPLGWECAAVAEIEKFPAAVLAHHYPNTPNLGDITKYETWSELGAIDILAGGTPCQGFSVAGLRGGLGDARSNLALCFLRIAARYRPKWIVWENVGGVFSVNGGGDFGQFLAGLAECGYGWSYRVLDTQFGRTLRFPRAIPQRRRRVFVVGYFGDWRRAAAVLFDRESLRGNPPPRREARKGIAPSLSARTKGGGGLGTDADCGGALVAHSLKCEGDDASEDGTGRGVPLVSRCVHTNEGTNLDFETSTIIPAIAFQPRIGRNGRGDMGDAVNAPSAQSGETGKGDAAPCVAIPIQEIGRRQSGTPQNGVGYGKDGDPMFTIQSGVQHGVAFQSSQSGVRTDDAHATLDSHNGIRRHNGVVQGYQVRRLTPTECERLFGLPDGYTAIPWRGKPASECPDGPRYRALGNSISINSLEWIGERIQLVNDL